MKSSTLITITVVLFVLCASVISFIVQRDLDPDYQKDWFAIGFVSLSDDTPDFQIENHSSASSFQYVIRSGGQTLSQDSFTLEKGMSLTVHPDNTNLKKPYTLTVTPENDMKKSESLTRK